MVDLRVQIPWAGDISGQFRDQMVRNASERTFIESVLIYSCLDHLEICIIHLLQGQDNSRSHKPTLRGVFLQQALNTAPGIPRYLYPQWAKRHNQYKNCYWELGFLLILLSRPTETNLPLTDKTLIYHQYPIFGQNLTKSPSEGKIT